ncbi:hypothetical protein KSU1_B0066 [Candidatus Jettenia caeni]|uniref:Uncharacterized protein n=1 Tax=Candidatus Jettenia caeni TaxID=247490 RepID=I3IGS8_9BACT|nr:hypothetical protein KSU1_B0066 [Candidatus Jettenia caeni]
MSTFELGYQTLSSFLIELMHPLTYGLTSPVDLTGNALYRFTRSNERQCQISFSQTLIFRRNTFLKQGFRCFSPFRIQLKHRIIPFITYLLIYRTILLNNFIRCSVSLV